MTKSSVFISYSHEGMDRDSLDAFISLLRDHLGSDWTVIHDRALRPGDNVDALMALLDSVEAVLLLLTPSYQRKVSERSGGVYEEYTTIMDRFDAHQESRRSGTSLAAVDNYFELIPVLFSGEHATAVPQELSRILHADFTGFRIPKRTRTDSERSNKRGEIVISKRLQAKYADPFDSLVSKLQSVSVMRTPASEARFDEYLGKFFLQRKARLNTPAEVDRREIGERFVKTHVFRKIDGGGAFFVVGRKGSGKSTLAGVLSTRYPHSKHRGAVLIDAEKLNLDLWYTTLMSEQPKSDMEHIFQHDRVFRFAWNLFIALCCVEDLALLDDQARLSVLQQEHLIPLRRLYRDLVPEDLQSGDTKSALFEYSLSQVKAYMNVCINKARPSPAHFLSDIELRFTQAQFLRHALGPTPTEALREALTSLRRRVLFALDGFDIAFDKFRQQTFTHDTPETSQQKARFESDWLRALLQVVLTAKDGDDHSHWLSEHLDYCIALPTDRFLEVVSTERDAYRYSERYVPLLWSGIELAILVRKRLEVLLDMTVPEGSPDFRLNAVLAQAAKHVPPAMTFAYNGRQYDLSLFAYVLRHTFWRPREVLWYYARILSAAEGLRRQGLKMSVEAVRRIVKDTTIEVVTTEFLGEFRTTFKNIAAVADAFVGARQRLSFAQIAERLRDTPFLFAIAKEPIQDIQRKISILYSIGFLGLVADRTLTERFALRERCIFAFAEGLLPLRAAAAKDGFESCEFVIHPAFCEYLTLDTSNQELVLTLSWEYLHDAEQSLFNTPNAFLYFGE